MAKTLSVVDVVFRGRTARFTRSLNRAESKSKQFTRVARRGLRRVAIAAGVTAGALTALGAKSVSAASKFEAGMTKVETLVGLARERVQGMRDDVLGIAQATGQGPEKLTEALFRLTSGGIRGEKVLQSLRQAARAAASGMGDVAELSRVATSSVQAFGGQGLDMAGALDTMLATVREGNIRISGFRTALETVQNVAAQAGLSFQELGAFIATASRTAESRKAARGLRQFLIRLQDPTEQIERAFKAAGTSVEEFRRDVQKRGLSGPLIELSQAAESNNVEFAKLFGRANAIASMMTVLKERTDSYRTIVERMKRPQGAVNDAFERTRETMANLAQRVRTTWETFKIRFGEQLAPLAGRVLRAFRTNMPRIAQTVAGAMQAMLRSIGSAGTFMLDTARFLVRSFDKMAGEIAGGLGLLGLIFFGPSGAAAVGTISTLAARLGRNVARIVHGPETEEARQSQRVLELVQERNSLLQRRRSLQKKLQKDPPHAANLRDELDSVNGELEKIQERLDLSLKTLERTPDAAEGVTAQLGEWTEGAREFFEFLQGVEIDMSGFRLPPPDPFSLPGSDAQRARGGAMGAGRRRTFGQGPARGVLTSPEEISRETIQKRRELARIREEGALMLGDLNDEASNQITIFDGITRAMSNLRSVASGTISNLVSLAAAIANMISRIMSSAGPGGIIGAAGGIVGTFAGFFQHGGTIPSGQFGIVGEEGPELVSGPAEVTPMQGGAGVLNAAALRPVTRATMAQDPEIQRWLGDLDDAGRLMGRD